MIWKRMNNAEAKKIVDDIEKISKDSFETLVSGWGMGKFSEKVDAEYRVIRDKVFDEYCNYKNKGDYEIDLRVGLALYELLLKDEYKLNPIYANDDDIWRYLSVRVFLDITYLREPSNDRFGVYFSHDRVYKHTLIKIYKPISKMEKAYSVLQAMIISACAILDIDENEISGCLQYQNDGSFCFVLYDTTPGGAGHVRRLNTQDMMEKLIKAAYYRAKNCTCGDEQGDSSCYGCLRMYRNQKYHDILKRRYVVEFLKDLVE